MSERLKDTAITKKVLATNLPDLGFGYPMVARDLVKVEIPEEQDVAEWILTTRKRIPDKVYGEEYNRLVCQKLDSLLFERLRAKGVVGEQIDDGKLRGEGEILRQEQGIPNLMAWSAELVLQETTTYLQDRERNNFLREKQRCGAERYLKEALAFSEKYTQVRGIKLSEEELNNLFSFWLLLKATQPYPLEDKEIIKTVLGQLAASFFENKELQVVSLVCASFIHQQVSEPGTVRVNPGPIEKVDGRDNDDIEALEKFAVTAELMRCYLGNRVKPYAILSDIDFVEVFKTTDSQALRELQDYWYQYEDKCQELGLIPLMFNDLLGGHQEAGKIFENSLGDIRENIELSFKSSRLRDPRWYVNPAYVHEMSNSIWKYYNSLSGVSMRWEVAYQNTVDKLAVYGSQPGVLRVVFPEGFIFVSSESPVRDWMYGIRDKKKHLRLMPIIYPFDISRI